MFENHPTGFLAAPHAVESGLNMISIFIYFHSFYLYEQLKRKT